MALIFAFSILVGCSSKPVDNVSSAIVQSEDAGQSDNASTESKTSSTTGKTSSTVGKTSSTTSKTESVSSKTNSVGIADGDWGDGDTGDYSDDISTSSTGSSSVKQYKNPKNIGLVAYHCSLFWCNSAGAELNNKIWDTPYEDRLEEFKQVVEANYFNQYFLTADNGDDNEWLNDMDIVVEEAKIIAKNGGSFWLYVNYNSQEETIKEYEEKLRNILNILEEAGVRNLVNGIHWDEPYYNNYSLKDLQDQMKVNYTVFGLRNFPVFGLAEFSDAVPSTNKKGEPMPWVCPEYSKYITDAGFDYYTVDVRDGASNGKGGAYTQHSAYLGQTVTSGKELYRAYTERLKNLIGHNFSIWYFPNAFGTKTWDMAAADENYSIAHLEFFAEELLDDEYPGGLALYTYHTHTQSHGYVGLQERIPLKDTSGNYTYYPKQSKWTKYFAKVNEYNETFSSLRYRYVSLDV